MNYLTKKFHALQMGNKFGSALRTISGYPLTLTGCTEGNLVNYRIYGNSVQNGTPAPDNPVSVQSVGDYDSESSKYIIPVTVSGINQARIGGENNYRVIYGIPVTEGDKITYIVNYTSSNVSVGGLIPRIYQDKGLSTLLKGYTAETALNQDIVKTITATHTGYFTFAYGNGRTVLGFTKLFVGIGTYTAGDYAPYRNPVTTNISLDEPLRKVGNYADYIDLQNRTTVRVVRKMEMGSYANKFGTYPSMPSNGGYSIYWNSQFSYAKENMGLSDRFPYSASETGASNHFTIEYTTNRMYIGIKSDIVPPSDNTQFRTWTSQNNPAFYFVRKTELTESINLPRIAVNSGTNIITAGTSIPPSSMEVSYYAESEE